MVTWVPYLVKEKKTVELQEISDKQSRYLNKNNKTNKEQVRTATHSKECKKKKNKKYQLTKLRETVI